MPEAARGHAWRPRCARISSRLAGDGDPRYGARGTAVTARSTVARGDGEEHDNGDAPLTTPWTCRSRTRKAHRRRPAETA